MTRYVPPGSKKKPQDLLLRLNEELRGHLGVPDTVSGPLIVPLNYPVVLH